MAGEIRIEALSADRCRVTQSDLANLADFGVLDGLASVLAIRARGSRSAKEPLV